MMHWRLVVASASDIVGDMCNVPGSSRYKCISTATVVRVNTLHLRSRGETSGNWKADWWSRLSSIPPCLVETWPR